MARGKSVRNLVLDVAKNGKGAEWLGTETLAAQVRAAAGRNVPSYSIYYTLRSLAQRGILQVEKRGREKFFRLAKGARLDTLRGPGRPPKSVATVSATPSGPSLPHKLGLGEILVLRVGESHVETATNLHGKLVVEKHPRARAL
jgi:hypothetical protein